MEKQEPESQRAVERQYTGQVSDQDATGLYYYNARYYSPQTANFTQADPIKGLNRYIYVSSNPLIYIDPEGQTENKLSYSDWFAQNEDSLIWPNERNLAYNTYGMMLWTYVMYAKYLDLDLSLRIGYNSISSSNFDSYEDYGMFVLDRMMFITDSQYSPRALFDDIRLQLQDQGLYWGNNYYFDNIADMPNNSDFQPGDLISVADYPGLLVSKVVSVEEFITMQESYIANQLQLALAKTNEDPNSIELCRRNVLNSQAMLFDARLHGTVPAMQKYHVVSTLLHEGGYSSGGGYPFDYSYTWDYPQQYKLNRYFPSYYSYTYMQSISKQSNNSGQFIFPDGFVPY